MRQTEALASVIFSVCVIFLFEGRFNNGHCRTHIFSGYGPGSIIEITEPEVRVWFDGGDLPIYDTPFINGQDSSRL